MNPRYFRTPLFDKSPESTGGDGPATPAPATPVPPVTEPKAETPPAPPAEPTTLQRVKALGMNKGSMLAERDAAILRATTAEAELVTLRGSVAALATENAIQKKELSDIASALKDSEAENKSVSVKAQEKIVELGIAADALPASASAGDSFEARYDAAKKDGTLHTFMKENKAEVRKHLTQGG